MNAATATLPRMTGKSWLSAIPYLLCHVAVLGVLWSGVNMTVLIAGFVLWQVRLFGVTAGYHRYFSHRTYRTSRPVQFLLALLAQSSSQKGVLWWAAHHRFHHKHSDEPVDIHSPKQRGFWYSHWMWIFAGDNDKTRLERVKDLAKFPELRFLDRFWILPPLLLAVGTFLLWGWAGLFVAFFASTVLCWHTTYTVNSLAHVFGRRRYDTTDTSRNNWGLAILTWGEGWHNNHHHYMNSCRQGFFWWEVDVTYYILKFLSFFGIVWGIKEPPAHVVARTATKTTSGSEQAS